MPYSTPADVRRLVQTTLTDGEIGLLIDESDAEIDHRIIWFNPEDALVRRLSALLTARHIRSAYPETVAIGEFSEKASVGDWGGEVERLIRLLSRAKMEAMKYRFIDEDERYPEAP